MWGLHPYSDIMAFEKADAAGRPAPAPSSTLTGQFANDLSMVGYHQHTHVPTATTAPWYPASTTSPDFTREWPALPAQAGGRSLTSARL